jgi:3-deoxy-manno-octulosonate cytidylyltransferase (CMP-KDO synthetase)
MFGVKDKAEACLALMKQAGAVAEQTACIGDDSIDLPAFSVCGISFAVADAPLYVQQAASRTLSLAGGQGAFRAVADKILQAQAKHHVLATVGYASVSDSTAQ